MAKKVNSQATSYKDYMGLPINIKRGNPVPLDTTAVWYERAAMETYAKSGATAYVGQVLVLALADVTEAYVIKDEAGTLIKLATTTASGDLASDIAALQGKVEKLEAATLEAADGSVTITKDADANKTTVKVNVSGETGNSISLKEDGLFAVGAEYSIKKLETATSGMAASYQLTKDGTGVGTVIDIPKDLVIKSGSVQTFTDETAPTIDGKKLTAGTYIVLVLNDKDETKLYIKADDLIEYVTSGSGENDSVQIAISADHKVTATIKDNSIDFNKLTQPLLESLGRADSAVQEITAGETVGTIKVDGIPVTVITDAYIESTVADDIATAKTEAITTAGTNADTKINAKVGDLGEKTVKAYVDDADAGLQGKIDTINATLGGLDLKALAHKDKVSETDLDTDLGAKVADIANKANSTDVTTAIATAKGEAIADAEGKIGTAKTELIGTKLTDTKDSDTIEGAKRYADAVASGAQGGLVGSDTDTSDKNTIYGAKKYAEEKASAAETAAKKAASDALTPVSEKATANETAITKLNGDKTVVGSVDNKIDNALTDLSYNKTATEGEFLVSAKQENGKISVVSKALAASDIPTLTTAKLSDFDTKMAEKQDKLTFTDTPSAENKVTTEKYVTDTVTAAVADLSGAMHFVGESTIDPTGEAGPTVEGYTKAFKAGDVVTFGNKEYVLDKTGAWKELGDEASYIVKGTKFKDADIAADANIAQSKIATTGTITDAIAAAKAAAEAAQTAAEAAQGTANTNTEAIAAINNLGIIKNTEATIKAVKVDAAVKADQDGDGNVIKTTYATKAEVTTLDESLATIAKTGNVKDLVQTAGDVIVLDCN